MKMTPNPIPLNGSLLSCSKDKESLCFNVEIEFRFEPVGTRKGKVDEISKCTEIIFEHHLTLFASAVE